MIYRQYIDDVMTGKVKTGEFIKLAVKRHLADMERQRTDEFPYYFDEAHGMRFITFAQLCKHWKGSYAKQFIKLEPHQHFYFMMLFGWMRETGGRRFRTSYKEIARKNGKTTECAVKALAHLKLDSEYGAQVYFAATKEDQAKIGFKDVQEIVKATPHMSELYKVNVKSVSMDSSFIKPLGSDSNTQDGFDPSYGIIDEYHAHPTSGMLNVLESGMGARLSPLIDVITTAGYNKTYPCYTDMRKTSIDVLRGIKIDETHLAIIYELDQDDDWQDESNWIKSNPNLGVSVRLDFLRDRFVKARNEGGSKEVDFKTKNLNIWTDSERTWIPDELWRSNNRGETDVTGLPCWGGLDLASTRDITALVLVFVTEEDNYIVKCHFYIPEVAVKERNTEGIQYADWANKGLLTVTPGNVTDYNYIKADIMKLANQYNIRGIAYDRWNASQLVVDLADNGIEMVQWGQGFSSMSAPTKELERLVMLGKVNHEGNEVLRWMCSNVLLKIDSAGNAKIDKAKSTEKVDGMVALTMALGLRISTGGETGISMYESADILTL